MYGYIYLTSVVIAVIAALYSMAQPVPAQQPDKFSPMGFIGMTCLPIYNSIVSVCFIIDISVKLFKKCFFKQ